MSAALSVQAVRKSYGRLEVLRGVELQVPAGTVFGLVGSNGAGKTTLFSIISGYLRPDAGEVRLFGQPVTPGQPPAWGRFGILPQDASFQERATVGQQLIMYGMLQGMTESEAARETRRVLESVQLMEVFDRRPGTLSHGMHKRIGIAQAFLGTPGLVILDEPTAGLDPNAARLIRGWIRSLSEACTVIVSSRFRQIEDLCDEVAIFASGTDRPAAHGRRRRRGGRVAADSPRAASHGGRPRTAQRAALRLDRDLVGRRRPHHRPLRSRLGGPRRRRAQGHRPAD